MNIRQHTISDVERGKGTLETFFKLVRALPVNVSIGSGKILADHHHKSNKAKVLLDLLKDT